MHQLNVTNPEKINFTDQIGISPARANELAAKMNAIVERHKNKLTLTYLIFNEILSICENFEEEMFCTISHCSYMAVVYGLIYCQPKKNRL